MSIVVKEIQVGWDVTTSLEAVQDLGLTTNAGAISVLPAGEGQVTIATLDKAQFQCWCAALSESGYAFTVAKPKHG